MPTLKNGQISLYCHFIKIIKGPGTSFKSPALSQYLVRTVCHTAYQYLTKFHVDSTQDKYISVISVTSQIHKNLDILRTEHYFFLTQKNLLIAHQRLFYGKKIFIAEVTSNMST